MTDARLSRMDGHSLEVETEEIDARIRFQRQPSPIPAAQRVSYRIATLCLILGSFKQNAASIDYLHLLSWAIRTRRSRAIMDSWWEGRRAVDSATVRLDPALPVTMNLALAHALVSFTGKNRRRLQLTNDGLALLQTLRASEDLLRIEKDFLASFDKLSDSSLAKRLGRVQA